MEGGWREVAVAGPRFRLWGLRGGTRRTQYRGVGVGRGGSLPRPRPLFAPCGAAVDVRAWGGSRPGAGTPAGEVRLPGKLLCGG